jgi:hypothetical protein
VVALCLVRKREPFAWLRVNKGSRTPKLFEVGGSDFGDPGVVVGGEAGFLLEGLDVTVDFRELFVGEFGDELVDGGGSRGIAVAAVEAIEDARGDFLAVD